MENVIYVSLLSNSILPNTPINAGVQGDDKVTVLNVNVDEIVFPAISDDQTLSVFAEAVNGVGEYYVTEFLEMVDNVITLPIPIEITRGGGQATIHFVFVVLDENGGQVFSKYSHEIRLRFEDSAQFYQSEYLNTMASALFELYKYRDMLADCDDSLTIQEHFDAVEKLISQLEEGYKKLDSGKVDIVEGYGLSKNDFNDEYKHTLEKYPNEIAEIFRKIEQVEEMSVKRTALPDGPIDLNTFITSGWWYTTEQRIDITNTPKDLAELELIVTKDVLSITQILIACDGGYGICYRFSHNSGKNWTDWQKIASDADFSSLNETLTDKFTQINNELDSKVSSVNGKNGTVAITGSDIPLEENSETLIGPFVSSINGSVLQMNENFTEVKEKLDGIEEGANKTIVDSELSDTSTNPLQNKVVSAKIKNHASFYVCSTKDNVEYIKLGKFTGNSNGERAIFTINGKSGWNNKNDGGLKILTLSSNHCDDSTSNDIHTGGTFYTFGHSNDNASSVIEGIATDIVLVRASGYSTKEVDVYIKISPTKYISYLVTVDYSDNCSWTTSTAEITSSDTNPTEGATSYFTVPKKHIADSDNLKELKTPKKSATSNSYTAPYCQSGIIADSLTELNKYRTTIGTATVSEEWNNIISVRHRNGADDGSNYGMYLRAPMIYESNLMWRQQFGASWKAEKTLLDSSNFTNYIPYETGTCTLSASNGTVSNATYSVVGNMVTLNFNIAPTGAGNVVVSGLPFTATKNQSGFASSTATYNITANQTSVSINSTSGTAEYCTVTYLK